MKLLMSIKPVYAARIFAGEKKYEYRRMLWKNHSVKTVLVYASYPVCKVVGKIEIEDIITGELSDIWDRTRHGSGITRFDYNNYFRGKNIANAIKIGNAIQYDTPHNLKDYGVSIPPQSFCYLDI